jgi:hypothetical protein
MSLGMARCKIKGADKLQRGDPEVFPNFFYAPNMLDVENNEDHMKESTCTSLSHEDYVSDRDHCSSLRPSFLPSGPLTLLHEDMRHLECIQQRVPINDSNKKNILNRPVINTHYNEQKLNVEEEAQIEVTALLEDHDSGIFEGRHFFFVEPTIHGSSLLRLF